MAQKAKRISDITKEFDLKSKDVIALFKDLGIEKNNGSTLDDTEYQLFLQVLTQQNQIENLDDYLDGKATLHSDRPKAAATSSSRAAGRTRVAISLRPGGSSSICDTSMSP